MKKYFYDECAIENREYGTIKRRDRLLVKCDEHRARGAVGRAGLTIPKVLGSNSTFSTKHMHITCLSPAVGVEMELRIKRNEHINSVRTDRII